MLNNITRIKELLEKYNIKMWLVINKDNSDPIFCNCISKNLYTQSFLFITKNKATLIISDLDKNCSDIPNILKSGVLVKVYNNYEEMIDLVESTICDMRYIDKIALSYSTLGDRDVDIISHSDLIKYTSIIRKIYKKYHKSVRFMSAEKIVYNLISQNDDLRLNRMRLIAKITHEILDETMNNIYTNMTEIEIASKVIYSMFEISKKYINEDLVNIDVAWDNAPFVSVGKNTSKSGHNLPSDTIFRKGDTIYIDFGIRATFSDGQILYTDMQRMGYALKDTESKVPDNINKIFNTLKDSIDNALDFMKPDAKGYKIDEIVRMKIIKEGYPNYNYASGHPVGTRVHSCGSIIGNKLLYPRSKIGLSEKSIYTLEPKISSENGGSIEEMIEITKYGGLPLYKFQNELYIIK